MANDKPQPQTVDDTIKKLAAFLKGAIKDGESVADCVVRVVTDQGNGIKAVAAERDRAVKEAAQANASLAMMSKQLVERDRELANARAELEAARKGGRVRIKHEPA